MFHTETYAHLADRWEGERYSTHQHHINETLALAAWLLPRSEKLTLVSGDHHHYHAATLCSEGNCVKQYQVSGMTIGSTAFVSTKLLFFFVLCTRIHLGWIGNVSIAFDDLSLNRNYLVLDGSWRVELAAANDIRQMEMEFVFRHLNWIVAAFAGIYLLLRVWKMRR
jgi:hypothetical protein